jgi:hypothetical protein
VVGRLDDLRDADRAHLVSRLARMASAREVSLSQRILAEFDRAADEIVDFAARVIRIPTINPRGGE